MRPVNDRDGPATATCIDLTQEQLDRLSDPAYLEQKFEELGPKARYWNRRLEPGEEESIVFMAFCTTRTRILVKGPVQNLDAYLHNTVRFICIGPSMKENHRRELFKKQEHNLAKQPMIACPAAKLRKREFWKRIAHALRTLPSPQHQAFKWCKVKGRSQRALEQEQGWYQGRAHRECNRACESLRALLADYCPHAESLPLTRNARFDR